MRLLEEKVLIGCGVWLLLLPFTGFPRSWKSVLTAITGMVVIYLAALLWRKNLIRHHAQHQSAFQAETVD